MATDRAGLRDHRAGGIQLDNLLVFLAVTQLDVFSLHQRDTYHFCLYHGYEPTGEPFCFIGTNHIESVIAQEMVL